MFYVNPNKFILFEKKNDMINTVLHIWNIKKNKIIYSLTICSWMDDKPYFCVSKTNKNIIFICVRAKYDKNIFLQLDIKIGAIKKMTTNINNTIYHIDHIFYDTNLSTHIKKFIKKFIKK
jgi:hypothetical protein